jgi:hypothetical protein
MIGTARLDGLVPLNANGNTERMAPIHDGLERLLKKDTAERLSLPRSM